MCRVCSAVGAWLGKGLFVNSRCWTLNRIGKTRRSWLCSPKQRASSMQTNNTPSTFGGNTRKGQLILAPDKKQERQADNNQQEPGTQARPRHEKPNPERAEQSPEHRVNNTQNQNQVQQELGSNSSQFSIRVQSLCQRPWNGFFWVFCSLKFLFSQPKLRFFEVSIAASY